MEIPKNKSIVDKTLLYRDKQVEIKETDQVVSYKNSQEDFSNYQLINNPERQFVVTQLASLFIPVASLFKTKIENYPVPRDVFLSEDVSNHFEYSSFGVDGKVNNALLLLIFNDSDHKIDEDHNVKNEIFFDFDHANFETRLGENEFVEYFTNIYPYRYIWSNFSNDEKQLFFDKLNYFEAHITGEEGFNFIKSLCKKAEYIEFSPEYIQKHLLSRIANIREMVKN